MPSWLVIVIISLCYLFILIALVGAISIAYAIRLHRYKVIVEECLKKSKEANEILDAYGTRNINIGKERD